jgi:hypothetical protein
MTKPPTFWVSQASQKASQVLIRQSDNVRNGSFSYSKSVSPAQLQTKPVYKG